MSVRADLKIFERVRDFIFPKMAATLQVHSSQINNFIKKVDDDNFVVCGRKRLFSAVFLNKGCDFRVCAFQEAKMADFLFGLGWCSHRLLYLPFHDFCVCQISFSTSKKGTFAFHRRNVF